MTSAAPDPVLRRKVAAGRDDLSLRAMSLPKALRLTIPKVADDLFGLPLAVIGVTQRRVTQTEAWALFSDETLLILLDGPDGIVGAAALDADLVGALIQQQTTGQVGAAKEEARAMTRTDAAMIAPCWTAFCSAAAHCWKPRQSGCTMSSKIPTNNRSPYISM